MTGPECFWLLRHAETTAPNVLNGAESDVPLSDHGQRQAELLAEWFEAKRPTAIVSSAMTRAKQTAAPIAARFGLPHHVEPLLHERAVGALSGQPFHLSEGPWAETLQSWQLGQTAKTSPGAESYDDLVARLVPAMNRLLARHCGERLVIVAHGIVCKVLLLEGLLGKSVADWTALGRIHNVSVSELRLADGGWEAVQLLQVPEPIRDFNDGTLSSAAVRSIA